MRNLFLSGTLCLSLFGQDLPHATPPVKVQALETNHLDPKKFLPFPPALDTLAGKAELELVLQVQGWRTPDMVAFARRVDRGSLWDYSEVLGTTFTPTTLPVTATLLTQVEAAIGSLTASAKKQFARKRPPFCEPRIHPCVKVSDTGSYPSGHASHIFTMGLVLAELFPEKREALLELARKSAWSRIIAGAHFPSDVEGGRLLGEALLAALNKQPAFLEALKKAQAEIAGLRLKKVG